MKVPELKDQLEPQAYKSLLARAEMCNTDPNWGWEREPKDRRHAMNACLDLKSARERVSNAEAELTRIKNGGGWYEDTPGGARKFCTVSEEQEVKTATEQVNTFRKLCEMMLIALRLHAGDLESGLIHRAREVLK